MGPFAAATAGALTACAASLLPAAASAAAAPRCSTVNFAGARLGSPLTAGSGGPGVPAWRMTTTKPRDRRGDVSAAFDTARPGTADPDLADRCTPARRPRCTPLGMVAVAVEAGIDAWRAACAAACDPAAAGHTAAACVAACTPDDDGLGATFALTWDAPVKVNYVRLLDVDDGETVTVNVGHGVDAYRIRGPGDDLNLLRMPIGAVPTDAAITITCSGSCALVDVGYCAAGGGATGTPAPTAGPSAATREPIVLAPISLGVLPRDAVRNSTRSFPVGSGTPFEDLFLLSDVTGSMSSSIDAVKAELPKIVAARSAVSGSVHFGVGSYRDEDDENQGWILDQPVTGDLDAVRAAVTGFYATGGGDSPEANLLALHRLATLPAAAVGWRDGARRVVAWFGDEDGHEPSCVDGGRTRLTRERVARELRAAFITVLGVNVGGNTATTGLDGETTAYGTCAAGAGPAAGDPDGTRPGQATFITTATGGTTARLSAGSSTLIIDTLAAVDALDVQLSAVTSGCDGVFAVSFDPPLPRTVSPGTTVTLTQTITVDARVCAALARPDAPFSCSVDYRASGGSFASQKVASQAITGC